MNHEIVFMKQHGQVVYVVDVMGNVKALKFGENDMPIKDFKKITEGRPTCLEAYEQHLVLGDDQGNITIINAPKCEVVSHITKPMDTKILAVSCFNEDVYMADTRGKLKLMKLAGLNKNNNMNQKFEKGVNNQSQQPGRPEQPNRQQSFPQQGPPPSSQMGSTNPGQLRGPGQQVPGQGQQYPPSMQSSQNGSNNRSGRNY